VAVGIGSVRSTPDEGACVIACGGCARFRCPGVVRKRGRSGAGGVLESGQPEEACGISHLHADRSLAAVRALRSARKMKNLRDLRKGLSVPKMLPSIPEVTARGPARRAANSFVAKRCEGCGRSANGHCRHCDFTGHPLGLLIATRRSTNGTADIATLRGDGDRFGPIDARRRGIFCCKALRGLRPQHEWVTADIATREASIRCCWRLRCRSANRHCRHCDFVN
jgi:hypothetical protein